MNLLKTSKFMSNTVRGAIGEIIAWQYLAKKLYPSFVQSLQGAIPCQAETYDPQNSRYALTDQQKRYLDGRFRRAWDFIADDYAQKLRIIYLLEVKTSGQYTATRHPPSWHDRRKLPRHEEINRVKRLGFTPILVKIFLKENWRVDISCENL
jgi:hypothetical protein